MTMLWSAYAPESVCEIDQIDIPTGWKPPFAPAFVPVLIEPKQRLVL